MKISIITVSYNSAKTIEATFKSVLNQTYSNIEYIVVDGGSNDGTLLIAENYSDLINILVSEPDNGIYHAMNKGIKLSTGDVIAILNSDDFFASSDIVFKVSEMINETKSDVIYGNINYINKVGKIVRLWNSFKYEKGSFAEGWHPPHPSLFVKKHIYDKYGDFDLDFNIASDFEFMLRIFENNDYKKTYLNETIVCMMTGGKSNTIQGVLEGNKEIKQAFKKNNIKYQKFYFFKRYLYKILEYLK